MAHVLDAVAVGDLRHPGQGCLGVGGMSNNDFSKMTFDELRHERDVWEENFRRSTGWPSAHFAAQCLQQVIDTAHKNFGVIWENKYRIMEG